MPERFRELIASARDVFATIDPSGSITYASNGFQTSLGLIPTDLVGNVLWELVHPDDMVAVHAALRAAYQEGGRRRLEFQMLDVQAKWRRFEATILLLLDGNEPQTAALIASDVTDLRQLEARLRERDAQLRQAQKMEVVGRMASGIAHDFGNLLTIIIGASGQMVDTLPADSPLQTHAQSIQLTAERAASLVRQLLGFGRQRESAPVVIDLNVLVADCEQLLDRLLGEHIELVTRCSDGLWLVKAERTQIEQVLLNLAANARDAMPAGGRLTIETRNVPAAERAGQAARASAAISVSDTGMGMDAATQARAFEPFFTTKSVGKGTGLGLANVHSIVREAGGWVDLASTVGRGTTVTFALPRVLEAATVQPPKAAAIGGKETLLIVEDEEGVRGLVCDFLSMAGYQVIDAPGPSEAEQVASSHEGEIQLVLTDVVMPEMSGLELAVRLRERRPGLRVMFMSGFPEPTVGDGKSAPPGTHFISKPFDRQGLLRAVRKALDDPAHD